MATDVGQRYARALLEVTEERKETDKAQAALQAIADGLAHSPQLQQVLIDPRMRADRYQVFEAIAQKVAAPAAVISLLRSLDAAERLDSLGLVAQSFIALADAKLGKVRGKVTSATALSDAQQKALAQSVTETVGKHVTLEFIVDPSLVGGVVVKVQDLVWDGSVKTQLDRMRTALRS